VLAGYVFGFRGGRNRQRGDGDVWAGVGKRTHNGDVGLAREWPGARPVRLVICRDLKSARKLAGSRPLTRCSVMSYSGRPATGDPQPHPAPPIRHRVQLLTGPRRSAIRTGRTSSPATSRTPRTRAQAMRTVGAVLRRRTTTTNAFTITRRYYTECHRHRHRPPPFSFTRNPQNPIYPIRNKFARLIPLPPPVVKQIAKTKAVRAAYLRRMDGGADAGVPEGGKAGDAKSIGVLSK